jgi:two-component system, LytTR family, response regulator
MERLLMPIRVLIIDDETLARDRLRDLLNYDSDIEIIGECANGKAALESIKELTPDLIFLDIQMPEMNGISVIEALDPTKLPYIIFVTAYDQYAVKAFDLYAMDYLLKPFCRDRFEKSMCRVKEQINGQNRNFNKQIISLLEEFKNSSSHADRLVVKTNGRILFLKTNEIDWIKAEGNYVKLYAGKNSYLIRDTISNLETKLNGKIFRRIHRSSIVNIDSIKELQPLFHGEYCVLLHDGTQLTLSRNYRESLQDLI